MSACIIRRKSDGLYRSRSTYYWNEKKLWTDNVKKARIYTNVGHAKNSLRDAKEIVNINWWDFKGKLTYNCENCCASKRHFCTKHAPMFPLIEKWLKKAIDNNFQWAYDVIPVEINIGPVV